MIIFYDEEKKAEMKRNIVAGLSNLACCISFVSHLSFCDEFQHEINKLKRERDILETIKDEFDIAIECGEDVEIAGNAYLLAMKWRAFDLEMFLKTFCI